MEPPASETGHRLISIARHFLGGKALDDLVGARAAIEKGCQFVLPTGLTAKTGAANEFGSVIAARLTTPVGEPSLQ